MKWKEMTNNLRWTMAAIHLVPCYWPGTLMCTCWKIFHPLKHPTPWESCLVADLIEQDRMVRLLPDDELAWNRPEFSPSPQAFIFGSFHISTSTKDTSPQSLGGECWTAKWPEFFQRKRHLVGTQKVFFVTPESMSFNLPAWDTRNTLYVYYVCIYVLWFVSSRAFAAETFLWKKASKTVKLGLVGWDILYVQIILADLVGVFLSEAVSRWRVCF